MAPVRFIIAAALTLANSLALGSPADLSLSPLPTEETQGSVRFRTGGIGEDEAAAMQQAESAYPLSVEFLQHAKPRDEFLASVEVTIKDGAGNAVLSTRSTGPFLLAQLPSGQYTVTAEDEGRIKTKRVEIAPHKRDRVVFIW